MTPLNLEQTLSYLRERMPAPFDLPQLAHLCRQGKLTPLISFVGIIATDYAPYELETFNGYITSLEFQRLLDAQSLEQLTITTALKFDDLNNTETWQTICLAIDDKAIGEGFFKDKDRTPYDYACNGFIRYPNGVTLTRNDLLFGLEQLESIAPAGNTQSQAGEPKSLPVIGEYTTPAMQAMNAVINEFWIDYTPDKIPPKQENVINWIMENYGFSRNLSLAIEQVARPESAKTGGNKAV